MPRILFGDQNEMVRQARDDGVTPIFDVADMPLKFAATYPTYSYVPRGMGESI